MTLRPYSHADAYLIEPIVRAWAAHEDPEQHELIGPLANALGAAGVAWPADFWQSDAPEANALEADMKRFQ